MEFFHIFNRGVDKRDVVLDEIDRVRFVQNLFLFNDSQPTPHDGHIRKKRIQNTHPRKKLVDIHAFCLMPNHYHMFISSTGDIGNIAKFMKKIGMGYAKYFNEKYQRSGYLWQGKYKKIQVEDDEHFIYLPYYIHLNPLDLIMPEWREGKVENTQKALDYLQKYRWSSYLDYLGEENFPSIITSNILTAPDIIGSSVQHINRIKTIITDEDIAAMSMQIE